MTSYPQPLSRSTQAIPAATVEWIKDSLDIVGLIGEFVALRRLGKSFCGRCPWHASKSGRSFQVDQGRRTWRCWSCGIGGDVVSFVRRFFSLSFRDAVAYLAQRAGVDVSAVPSPEVARRAAERRELAAIDRQFRAAERVELIRLGRDLADARRLYRAASARLGEIECGASIRFSEEREACWEALRLAIDEIRGSDAGYALLAFGTAGERDDWIAFPDRRGQMIAAALARGFVANDRRARHGVPAQ